MNNLSKLRNLSWLICFITSLVLLVSLIILDVLVVAQTSAQIIASGFGLSSGLCVTTYKRVWKVESKE